jgi:hypothetical protein
VPSNPNVQYRICPLCARAVPISSLEHHCINDGTKLLEACPRCEATIHSPYALHCSSCGFEFAQAEKTFEPFDVLPPIEPKPKPHRIRIAMAITTACVALLLGFWQLTQNTVVPNLKTVFVGRIPASEALIAIAIQEQRVLAYVCDGKTINEWFKGTTQPDNSLELRSKSGATLVVQLSPKSAQGTLELNTGNYVFSALPSREKAAFYRSEGLNRVAGWVILPNGTTKSAIRVDQKIVPAPRINTANTVMQLQQLNLSPAQQINPNLPNSYPF